jgi:amino acid transporter
VTRREWLRAMRRELEEAHGRERAGWLLGIARVAAASVAGPLVAAAVVVGVLGGAFGTHEVFLEVARSGSESWIGALLLTVPTAIVGLAAAMLVLRRHRGAPAAAYAFAALVAVSSVLSIGDLPPVRPFMDDWQRVTADPRATDHAGELRMNSALGALGAAAALVVVARRTRRRTA